MRGFGHVGPSPGRTIEQDFREFHAAHPEVYVRLVAMCHEAKLAGVHRIGIGMLWEVLRWERTIKRNGEDFKLNNNYRSYYARLIMTHNPSLSGIFETRMLSTRDPFAITVSPRS